MPLNFAFAEIYCTKGDVNPAQHLRQAIKKDKKGNFDGVEIWGIFSGIFGMSPNELFFVSMGNVSELEKKITGLDDFYGFPRSVIYLEPTVRPTDYAPRDKPGLYVFRFFDVMHKDVNEIASLSKKAWETFETSSEYNAEPQALFCQQDRSEEQGQMLLVTWYDSLASWETSRKPPIEASENFQARSRLTLSTKPYATRLYVPN